MKRKVICVWIGTSESENNLYQNYLNFDYENEEDPESEFGKDAGLEYYDEDFMESWWYPKLELNTLFEDKNYLLDFEYFFDDLINELKSRNLTNRNFISFLFGEKGEYPTNEMLFEYKGIEMKNKRIEFIFKKEYKLK